MKVIDCYWEKNNIGNTTAEIEVEESDTFDFNTFNEIEKNFEYVVVKVPMNKPLFNFELTNRGYTMVEVQCKLSKDYKDFDFDNRIIQRIMPSVSFNIIEDKKDFDCLIKRITPGMFSTDRISLDPYYGLETAAQRYRNWMTSFFNDNKAEFLSLLHNNKDVGFSMYKQEGDCIEMILGGIFEEYQSHGIGIMTPTRHLLYAKQTGTPLKRVSTTISSNNTAVWKIYNYFNFKIDKLYYVYVKHI